MADNYPQHGGETYATDEIAAVNYLIVKLAHGAADSATLVSTGSGLPVNVVAGGAGDGAILDGANSAIKATVKDLTNSNPLTTAIVDGNGDQITSFGGGTQYTEADTDATITGTAIMFESNTGTNALSVVNNTTPLPVSDAGGTLTVDGTVTIQDGGNTITVDNGGTFAVQIDAGAVTSLALLDDVIFADDVGFTPATSKVTAIGAMADETSPDSVDEGDIGIPRMTLDRFLRVVVEQLDTVRAGGTSRAVTRTAVAAASSGDNTIATNSNGGLIIRVYAMALVSTAANNIYFTADGGGTVVFGGSTNKIALAANSGFVLPYNPLGWFQTSANTDVVMNLSAASSVSGIIIWAEV